MRWFWFLWRWWQPAPPPRTQINVDGEFLTRLSIAAEFLTRILIETAMATKADIQIFNGDDGIDIVVRVLDPETNMPLTIADDALVEWILLPNAEARPLVYKRSGYGITVADQVASKGFLTIALDGIDTEDMDPGDYYHECRLTQGGASTPVFTGKATIMPSAVGLLSQ